MLARGELQTIGATTLDEYRKYVEKDPALERRFQPIQVGEPSVTHTIEILKGLRDRYEAHHRVTITDRRCVAAATLPIATSPTGSCPTRPSTSSTRRARGHAHPPHDRAAPDLREFDEKIANVRRDKESAIDAQDFERAAHLRDSEKQLLALKGRAARSSGSRVIWTSSPRSTTSRSPRSWPTGQVSPSSSSPRRRPRVCSAWRTSCTSGSSAGRGREVVAQAIRRTRAGLKDPKRRRGSFIFAGPSGVGKTELSKALANFLFGEDDALIQIDMGEFHGPLTPPRGCSVPLGYVGYEEGGQLTEKVRRKPFPVVLFDEIEKAHQEVYNTLCRCWKTAASPTARAARSTSRTP
jgi:ATP-dependent Clp protease ATP-binding subunit ClpC